MKKRTAAIIGAGPAGLAAACAASAAGNRCVVFEQLSSPGAKLLASGGGKCNVTNVLGKEEFAKKFGSQWRFMLPALNEFFGGNLLDFFADRGVKLVARDGFHYFPETESARDVLNLFLEEIKSADGYVKCSAKVASLIIDSGIVKGVRFADGTEFAADAVIIATGGKSYPALGGRGAGYVFAESAGHKITELFPAMTGVHTAETWVHNCAGIALDDVITYIDLPKWRKNQFRGELLFTHNGFSAFAILDMAGSVAKLLSKNPTVPLRINFTPELTRDEWEKNFAFWRQKHGTKKVVSLLSEYLPRKVASALVGDDDVIAARLRGRDQEALLEKVINSPFTLTATDLWDKAMVTEGGVSLKELSPDTLESKLVSGLYFAGEVLDLTGPCGGYNITWALASGMLAGRLL